MVEKTETPLAEDDDDFTLVIPEFGPCGTETDPSLHPDEPETKKSCNDCSCEEKKEVLVEQSLNTQQSSQQNSTTLKNPCTKCHIVNATMKLKNDVVCKSCYLQNVTHKFKNTLQRHCRIQKDFPNLLAVSGGSNSMAALHMIYKCLAGNETQRKMFFKIHVIYIDESCVYQLSPEECESRKQFIKQTCEKYALGLTIVPIESAYDLKGGVEMGFGQTQEQPDDLETSRYKNWHPELPVGKTIATSGSTDENRARLHAMLQSVNPTAQADILWYMKKVILIDFALKFNIKRVLLGTSGNAISSKLLSALSKGRGAQIASEVSYCDEIYCNGRVTFCKPLRDVLQKEIAVYNFFHKVEIIAQRSLAELQVSKFPAPTFGSTDLIIEQFFKKLQAGYNTNTVPTVLRLTAKLKSSQKIQTQCPLCLGPCDKINNLLEVGSTISQILRDENQEVAEVKTVTSDKEWFPSMMEQSICFGCKRIAIEARNKQALLDNLPDWFKENAQANL